MNADQRRPASNERRPISGDQRPQHAERRPISGDQRPQNAERRPYNGGPGAVHGASRPMNADQRPRRPIDGDQRRPFDGDQRRPINGDQRPRNGERRPFDGNHSVRTENNGGQRHAHGGHSERRFPNAPERSGRPLQQHHRPRRHATGDSAPPPALPAQSAPSALALDPFVAGTGSTTSGSATTFAALGLIAELQRAVADEGYTQPTPVQIEVVPLVLARRDVVASAQTGTGKTAAFVLPLLQLLRESDLPLGPVRVLVLSPTRELAAQIAERCAAYGRFANIEHALIYGGVSPMRQIAALRRKPAIVIATPGRLLDLINQRALDLREVRHLVLDEADRMLDMGFIRDVRRIAGLVPRERQTLLFSATMPREIEALAQSLLRDPARVALAPRVAAASTVEQAVVYVERDKKAALLMHMLEDRDIERAIVFTRTKRGSNRLSKQLGLAGIDASAINGDKSQAARERALDSFRQGRTRVLVATDVAARGIDVDGVSHVINFDLPEVAESYVHRVGRTGRAGASGRAISFCGRDERPLLTEIERLLRQRLAVLDAAAPARAAGQSTSAQSRA